MPVHKIIISALIFFSVGITPLTAGTEVTDPDGLFTPEGFALVDEQIRKIHDRFGRGVANASLMANLSGYPACTANFGMFPRFALGFSVNTGLSNLERFDDDVEDSENIMPAAMFYPSLFLGLGLVPGFDAMFKFMLYSDDFYNPDRAADDFNLERIKTYAAGVKLRKLLVEPVTVVPLMLRFGGIALTVGADVLYGRVKVNGETSAYFLSVPIEESVAPLIPAGSYDIEMKSYYDLDVGWYIFSGSTSMLVYFEGFWVFGFYTGLGAAVTYGSFDIDFASETVLILEDDAYSGLSPGSIFIVSDEKYSPYIFSPLYIFGAEFNLRFCRLSFETMVNLRNRSDINLQFGARVQY